MFAAQFGNRSHLDETSSGLCRANVSKGPRPGHLFFCRIFEFVLVIYRFQVAVQRTDECRTAAGG